MNSPPFLVSFSSTELYLKALADDVRASYGSSLEELANRGLPPVVSIRSLATLFGYSPRLIGALCHQPHRYYRIFSIPKGNEQRTIQAPKVGLKVIQKWFGYHLAKAIEFDHAVYGFIPGRSSAGAAYSHCGADWVYSVDIEDFFNSIPLSKVSAALVSLGYSQHGAELAAKLCCYKGYLAQGSPASPPLSNLVFREADDELIAIAERNGARYTRYADDMVFSGQGDFPDIKSAVHTVIEARGWKIAATKERISRRPNRLKVHGLLVHGDKPRLTKGYRNRIRAFKHLIVTGRVSKDDLTRLLGHISYSNSVNNVVDKSSLRQDKAS
jgi:RNA-directed DNA polymerase